MSRDAMLRVCIKETRAQPRRGEIMVENAVTKTRPAETRCIASVPQGTDVNEKEELEEEINRD